jgi:hypothetical protein
MASVACPSATFKPDTQAVFWLAVPDGARGKLLIAGRQDSPIPSSCRVAEGTVEGDGSVGVELDLPVGTKVLLTGVDQDGRPAEIACFARPFRIVPH